ncbi:MAG: GxGYxYP family putative glycoside hydrolase [Opitutaceae bacterium]|nr:GxGYxYP family putative glycoside hydrolase [Opitutaceae bacterium]
MKRFHSTPAWQKHRVFGGALALIGSVWLGLAATGFASAQPTGPQEAPADRPLYTYTLTQNGTPAAYDEALAVASLQGIINREAPEVYVLSRTYARPQFWLDLLTKDGRWLEGRAQKPLSDLDALMQLAGDRLKGVVIWDPAVPASMNVATTIAGVRDAVVLSPEFADRYLARWHLPVIEDLRGRFTGAETGSKKNDAYRWAIRQYLAKGLCSSHLLCLFEDSFATRVRSDTSYVVTRDWAVKNRAFVFDLSPWGDEKPQDDPDQRLGLDLETYRLILDETLRHSAGRHMTELAGFFAFSKYSNMPDHKSAHEPVPTEWETVWLISPYNAYQNTVASNCFNQSLHSQAPRPVLKQHRTAKPVAIENKTYLCILMADYDSATPLYDLLPNHWHNPGRGKLPLAWGINPNLLETYPDLIAYFYSTATPADTFTSDASAAGYMNPNRVRQEYLPLFVQHNQRFFREADMTIAPMVLDWQEPTPAVKDAYQQFAPDGYATIVWDMHTNSGKGPAPQVWKGMPILELINDANEFPGVEKTAGIMSHAITTRGGQIPGFYFFRIVWTNPTNIADTLAALHRQRPDLNFEVLDPYTFFALFKKSMER